MYIYSRRSIYIGFRDNLFSPLPSNRRPPTLHTRGCAPKNRAGEQYQVKARYKFRTNALHRELVLRLFTRFHPYPTGDRLHCTREGVRLQNRAGEQYQVIKHGTNLRPTLCYREIFICTHTRTHTHTHTYIYIHIYIYIYIYMYIHLYL